MLLELTRAVESRHPWTRGHAHRVGALALAVARALDWDERQLEAVRVGAQLHDVGKLSLAPEVLGKPGPLTAAELEEVRRHPSAGARIVASLPNGARALPCVLFHHERWDGDGYPSRIAGDAIPVEARLVAVADAFDAMTSARPYRAAFTAEAAFAELDRCAGSQFDPLLADVCVATWSRELRLAV
jgi:HD-GYP domain-containing protein (c-di-GMP phosphodiesterase class II)